MEGLCWARKCRERRQNRDCLTCINYYQLDPSNRFCILYTCRHSSCYLVDDAPPGFFYNGSWLNITSCIQYQGPNCISCENYRFPNQLVQFGLCYPYNCRNISLINCQNNCLNYFGNPMIDFGACTADNCLRLNSNGRCMICQQLYNLSNGICIKKEV